MKLKKKVKRLGKGFIDLRQENESCIGQSILIVDNGYSWIGHFDSAIEGTRNFFPKAEVSTLTFEERKNNLQKDFPNLNYILPASGLRPKRYQLALQMFKLRKQKYDFVVLLSLDITPVIVALVLLKSKVVLYNQWGQWWTLQIRGIKEAFKVTYVKKRASFSLKNLFKRIGLFFVLLQRQDKQALRHSILVVDNGCASYEQIHCSIQHMKEALPQAKISVLTPEPRGELKNKFPDLEMIRASECAIKKYRLARHMLKIKHKRYDHTILLSLDITPIIASILFMRGRVLLYNRWHQWWSLKPKPMRGYLLAIPQFIFNILIFVYLLISVSWIFLKRSVNVFKFNLLRRSV